MLPTLGRIQGYTQATFFINTVHVLFNLLQKNIAFLDSWELPTLGAALCYAQATHTHRHAQTDRHTHRQTDRQTDTHARTHTHTNPHTHARTHARTHINTDTHLKNRAK
jgi:hypothetical protein